MDSTLGVLALLALIVSGAAQVVMAIEMRLIRIHLSEIKPDKSPFPHHSSHFTPTGDGMLGLRAGYAIYAYRSGRWELEADLSAAGYEPSAPGLPGAYEGQVLKKESAPGRGR